MTLNTRAIAAILLCSYSSFASSASRAGHGERRGFDVEDSIEMTTFNEPSALDTGDSARRSPDGKYFWLITTKGEIKSNQLESTLWLFASDSIERFLASTGEKSAAGAPVPRAVARITASPGIMAYDASSALITDVRWTPDSRKLFFLGQDSLPEKRLYEVDVTRGRMTALTPQGYGVREFDFSGKTIVFTALASGAGVLPVADPSGGSVTGLGLEDILFPEEGHGFGTGKFLPDLWILRGRRLRHLAALEEGRPVPDTEHSNNVLSLSPDGRKLVRLVPAQAAKPEWARFDPKPGFESWRIDPKDSANTAPSNWYRLRQYELVDTITGRQTLLIDGPNALSLAEEDRSMAVWSRDGRRMLIGNVALAGEAEGQVEQARHQPSCALAVVDVSTLKAECVVSTRDASSVMTSENPRPERLQDAAFGSTPDELVLRFSWHDEWGQTERYRYEAGLWKRVQVISGDPVTGAQPADDAGGQKQSLTIRQGLNSAPVLWANDTASKQSRPLWDPNPQFATLNFGKAALYHWRDGTGYEWTGVLVYPTGYVAGERYPLVIQTHGILEAAFITDGAYPTAMAARPLASAGFVVLQTTWRTDHWATDREAADQLAGFEGAITHLDADGLIDPNRVGIVGFSRSCWHVEEALVSRPKLFAAATIADGMDAGYLQYRIFGEGRPSMRKEFEQIIGGSPEGSGLDLWVSKSPAFHFDRAQTPLRIEAIGRASVLMEWEAYSSLRQYKRPVDLIYLPDAQHVLQRPLERLVSQQGDVDWFRFWLEGREDVSPSKVEQYRRWRNLRALANAQH